MDCITHQPVSVLIVEDEVELAEMLDHNLRKKGLKTLIAHDGLTACRLVGSEAPDVILLDILLPDLDGWEICRMVRAHPSSNIARTPIIIMTALSGAHNRARGRELGADAYIPKPYSLREVVMNTLRLGEQHGEWLSQQVSGKAALPGQAIKTEYAEKDIPQGTSSGSLLGGAVSQTV